jgi:hypothetical protein
MLRRKSPITCFAFALLAASACAHDKVPLGTDIDATVAPSDASATLSCSQPFMPCGGDVVGTWRLAQVCGQPTDVFPQICATATTTVSINGTETMAIDANTLVSTKMDTSVYTTDASSCIGGTSHDTCATIGARVPELTCASTATSACVCTWTVPANTAPTTYDYATSGDVITFWQPGMTGMYGAAYCIGGNSMTVSLPSLPDFTDLYVKE